MAQQKDKDDVSSQSATTVCEAKSTEEVLPQPEAFIAEGTATELQKTDLSQGDGAEAKNGDCLVMKYYGTLASDGTMFDENYTTAIGFAFTLGSGQVIQGWDQGLVGMKVGGERRLVIPANLGYGEAGSPPKIPANADLVFVVKLLRIQK
ncbi:FKBP-type peptidyl-prolyl cis-trans isomerase [Candidatus Saccharibacteria bacterium]|nr:FKBP-type peptidyl-prolyl cis-trans isomerase [Candidatus Saccharibacteria bacterium]